MVLLDLGSKHMSERVIISSMKDHMELLVLDCS